MKPIRLASRLLRYVSAVLIIVSLNFFLIHLMPGDPLVYLLGKENYYYFQSYDPEALDRAREKYQLDQPLYHQYLTYIAGTAHGDFGWTSHYEKPVLNVILFRLKWTLILLFPAVIATATVGAVAGALAGRRKGSRTDRLLTPILLFLHACPSHCLGLLLMLALAFHLDLFPLGGMGSSSISGRNGGAFDLLWHWTLPFLTLVLHGAASHYLVMRNTIRQIRDEEYILTALAKGLSQIRILFRHVLPNALPPLLTVVALDFGYMVGGVILVEMVFSWQGMGTLMQEAVLSRDYPLLSGCLVVLSICVITANALADLAYSILDPRVRDGAAAV